jgi:RNA polymerase sigma-70 factor (ECF subfamily)
MIEQLADDNSAATQLWNREHDAHVLRQLLMRIEPDFEPATFQAFQRQVFDGATADEVARELGISVGAAYCAKSRVLRRLRQEAAGAVDSAVMP